MARFNEILTGRINRFMQKVFAMKGGPPVPQLSGDVQTSFPLFSGQENRYLESWQQFGFSTLTGLPGAGNRAAWRIRNPSGSGVIAIIEKLSIFENTGADNPLLFYNSIATVLPTENQSGLSGTNTDSRGQQTGSVCILSTSINFGALGTGQIWQGTIPNTGTIVEVIATENQELVLPPGSQLTVAGNVLVQTFNVAVWWRERVLEESERT